MQGMSETATLDAQVLLAHVLSRSRAWIMAHPEAELSLEQEKQLSAGLARLKSGVPLPYVLGHWEFYGLDFIVTPVVLIPRPETELLVDQALSWLAVHPAARRAIDVGAGSGCITVSLAVHVPDLYLVATDLSPAALQVARGNAERHGVAERIKFLQADILDNLVGQTVSLPKTFTPPYNLITANLPYIPSGRLQSLEVSGREPTLALDGGLDGLDLIRRLLQQAPSLLSPAALLLLEIDAAQGEQARALAQSTFPDANIQVLKDLSDHDRLLKIET
jgi:release factor glutamine methyltransferase